MKANIAEEILSIAAQLMTATDKVATVQLTNRLNVIAAETLAEHEDSDTRRTTTGYLHLTQKEIAEMPKNFRKEFIALGCVCRVTKRPSGKRNYCYECRYRRNGYNVSVSSTNPEEAKEKFIEKLKEALKNGTTQKKSAMSFENIAEEWFAHRKSRIVEGTYKHYYSYYSRYILPKLKDLAIDKIRTSDLDEIMQCIIDKGRVYEDTRSILNQIFNYAIHNGIITHNPTTLIPFIRAEREHGDALSYEEELSLIAALNTPKYEKYKQPILAMLFFGLRPCELNDAKIEGKMMIARNRKRKNGKIEYKKIPLSPVATRFYDPNIPCTPCCVDNQLRVIFNSLVPNHKLYDLRHTFASRCQMFVRQEIVEIWLGDSPERIIGNTYTHFPDSFMIEEMQKVDYLP